MRKEKPADSPDAYVVALDGWRRETVERLRAAVLAAGALEERIKWGHIVCFSNGPVLLIRAEAARVLFGFWRGKRLREIEPRLKPGGKYEMATMVYVEGGPVDTAVAERLAREAIRLNAEIGDPTRSS
ncbi:DUF1801 domain-containing protein [Shinella yambaruensis]|uniref:YdhG-like domain-containing protein n=1 Tax=Shinella yambaruensis TaxID=415996 RepID=A0ABQ5ZQ90_9HYPH|nr:DUF1801 domain-containing protein [Shinella yambaruensis]MCJ8025504.1 DUF1801 domain-containing protein [Shinella yambaruensis]MCU7979756.1 DUF1801 domain-containing protein [Shinella yambaruensis]GLR53216.1 hypothetical protein GCM10007923_44310 [Shinella yambaruensis]